MLYRTLFSHFKLLLYSSDTDDSFCRRNARLAQIKFFNPGIYGESIYRLLIKKKYAAEMKKMDAIMVFKICVKERNDVFGIPFKILLECLVVIIDSNVKL